MTRILVVDDEQAIASLVTDSLVEADHEAVLLRCAEHAHRDVEREVPDLVVIDWTLPGRSGIELVRQWRGDMRTRHLPVIMFTRRGSEHDRIAGLDAGVDHFLVKPSSINELLARVRALLRSPHEGADDIIEVQGLKLDPYARRVMREHREVRIRATECKVLHFLMQNAEHAHSREHLLNSIWGDDSSIMPRTIDVHIKALRDALSELDCADMIETAHGVGYRFSGRTQLATA